MRRTNRPLDDSLICKECGSGPYCDECYATHGGEHLCGSPIGMIAGSSPLIIPAFAGMTEQTG